MSKITNAMNQIWHEQDGEQIKFGFTRNFLDTLDECWHILPAGHAVIKAKAPLMTVETNDSLVSILAPVGGNFLRWNETASNFPDKLTENDVIMTLTSAKVAAAPVEETQLERLHRRQREIEAAARAVRGNNAAAVRSPFAEHIRQGDTIRGVGRAEAMNTTTTRWQMPAVEMWEATTMEAVPLPAPREAATGRPVRPQDENL